MENAKRYILGVIMLLALIQGCYEDEGNYDYSPLPSIQINGMNTIYQAIIGFVDHSYHGGNRICIFRFEIHVVYF